MLIQKILVRREEIHLKSKRNDEHYPKTSIKNDPKNDHQIHIFVLIYYSVINPNTYVY